MKLLSRQVAEIVNSTAKDNVYCIIDAVQASTCQPDWQTTLRQDDAQAYILGRGVEASTHAHIFPWLIEVKKNGAVGSLLVEQAGNNLGVILYGEDMLTIAHELIPLCHAVLPDNSIAWFRFYDPRVLSLFFPWTSPEQKSKFFGRAVTDFFVENSITNMMELHKRPDTLPNNESESFLYITATQKELLDEGHYQYFLHTIFSNIKDKELYKEIPEHTIIASIVAVTEWGYARGVTDSEELHDLSVKLLELPWNGHVAHLLAQHLSRHVFSNQTAKREFICAQRKTLREQS